MTNNEIARRLISMTDDQISRVSDLVRQGYGAQGIKFETGLTIKQINAVFERVARFNAECPARAAR